MVIPSDKTLSIVPMTSSSIIASINFESKMFLICSSDDSSSLDSLSDEEKGT
jgi:hypothetical protein